MPRRSISEFGRDQAGAVAVTYALAITALVAIAGVGFDYGRMASLDTELQNASDQAALAGASQLDGRTNACSRASDAVTNFVANSTRFANDGGAPLVTFRNEASCDATGSIRFWQDKEKITAASSDANARFIEVIVDARTARYALTPIVGAITSGQMTAGALAGLGSSICKVPPLMICSPDPTQPFNADAKRGLGVVATGHSTQSSNQGGTAGTGSNNTWAPGDFGFLQIQDDGTAGGRNAKLLRALAYLNPPIDCVSVDDNRVSTGNPQGLYDAINTRFDIYDFNSSGNGNVLATCKGGDCPSAPNVVKDFTNSNPNQGANSCKIRQGGNGAGWALPSLGNELKPETKTGSTNATAFDDNGLIDVMGLPRDNCHYMSYNGSGFCAGGTGRFGNGVWDRSDYFRVNHTVGGAVDYPPDWTNISRYDTYLWELNNNKVPNGNGANSQRGAPVCFAGNPAGTRERRILTVAIVSNCAALNGQSQPVQIDEFADVFLVEPSIDDPRRYNAFKDAVYMEIIGKSKVAGSGTYNTQQVRRDVPFLVR